MSDRAMEHENSHNVSGETENEGRSSCVKFSVLHVHDENSLLKIGKFSELSFLCNPYYHNKDESLLWWGYQVKPLQEMVSTQLKM